MTRTTDMIQVGMVLACGAVAAGAGRVILRQSVGHWGIEQALGVGLSMMGVVLICAWLLALAAALAAELLQRRNRPAAARCAARCTPAAMRRLATAVLGIHLIAAPGTAQAFDAGTGGPVSASVRVPGSPAGTATVAAPDAPAPTDRPTGTSVGDPASPYWRAPPVPATGGQEMEAAPPTGCPPVPPTWEPTPMPPSGGLMLGAETRVTGGAAEVIVAPGDSLWAIVALRLGPFATAADVAEAWPSWYAANRSTIGDDPSLLFPGQVLHAPPH